MNYEHLILDSIEDWNMVNNKLLKYACLERAAGASSPGNPRLAKEVGLPVSGQ